MIPRTDCLKCNLQKQLRLLFLGSESVKSKSLSRVRLCDPMDYTVHGILQARILEWVAFPFSRGSSQPRDRTQVCCIAGRFFTSWATREALFLEGTYYLSPYRGKQKNYFKYFWKTKWFSVFTGTHLKGQSLQLPFKYAVGPVIKRLSAFPR